MLYGLLGINQFIVGFLNHLFPKAFVRPSTLFVKEQNKKDLIVVEIGTDKGYNARAMLETLDIKKIYLVDPYPWDNEPEDSLGLSLARTGSSAAYEIAKQKLKKFENKIEFIKKASDKAVDDIPDNVDLFYIDAIHTKEWVEKELKLYYPKLKKGGVMAGHDFMGDFIGVAEAVIIFTQKHKKKLHGKNTDWWFVR